MKAKPTFRVGKQMMAFLLMLASCFPSDALAQVDPARRLFVQGGVSLYPDADRDVDGYGALYWNEPGLLFEGEGDFSLIFAGLFVQPTVVFPNALGPSTAVGFGLNGLFYLAGPSAPIVDGVEVKKEGARGNSGYAEVFVNHLAAELTPRKIPLNLQIAYRAGAANYWRDSDTARDYLLPRDGFWNEVEGKIQLGGVRPGIRDIMALGVYLKGIAGYRPGWNDFGPADDPYSTGNGYGKVYLVGTASIPTAPGHFTGLTLAGAKGWSLDPTTQFALGGTMVRAREPSRLAGYYTSEFLADSYFLVNASHQLPLSGWHQLAGHLMLDFAAIQNDRTLGGTSTFTGVGAAISAAELAGFDWKIGYGYGIDAKRNGSRGGHEITLEFSRSF